MRKLAILVAGVMLALTPALAVAQSLTASLAGGPGGDPDGTGFAVLSMMGTSLDYTILVQHIGSPTGARIYRSANDTVALDLQANFIGGLATGNLTVDAGTAAALLANPAGYHLRVSNGEFPNGAVRGPLAATGAQHVVVIPVIAKLAGQADTNFVSDLTIGNPSSSEIQVSAEWYPTGATLTGPARTASVSVPANGQMYVADAVGALFAAGNTRGGLILRSAAAFSAQVRTYNDQRANPNPDRQGTYGQFVTGLAVGEAATAGVMYGLSQRPAADARDFRTNIGWFNPTGAAVPVTFAAFKADGTALGQVSITVPAYGNDIRSVFDLINTVTDRVQPDFFVTYQAGAGIFVFATVNDNRTGDGIHIASKGVM